MIHPLHLSKKNDINIITVAKRKIPLINEEIYHVFNRGVEHRPIFTNRRNYQRFIRTLNFYRFHPLPTRLSDFLTFSKKRRMELLDKLQRKNKRLVEIFCFCFMPNHYHFLLKQLVDNGITKFIGNSQNSYTKYFNTRNDRIGPLFQGPFKAKRIETDKQLLHLSRYIHLNPYSSCLVKSLDTLREYPWSSLNNYLKPSKTNFIQEKLVLNYFKNRKNYQNFIWNQADYQRKLEIIKHLTLDF